jgi:hypothetical protein
MQNLRVQRLMIDTRYILELQQRIALIEQSEKGQRSPFISNFDTQTNGLFSLVAFQPNVPADLLQIQRITKMHHWTELLLRIMTSPRTTKTQILA